MNDVDAFDVPWGADSEYGRLLDVLLCPPDNFRWLPTSAISRATLTVTSATRAIRSAWNNRTGHGHQAGAA